MPISYPYTTFCTLAGLPVRFRHRYPYLSDVCRDYTAKFPPAAALLTLTVTQDDVNYERSQAEGHLPESLLEATAAFRLFCEAALPHRRIMLHACTVEADGRAYAFVAPSGTGKTTHARLWLSCLGARARILNGDKPILHVAEDGTTVAYGTPWNGKENLGVPASAPLAGICLLERGETNHIRRLPEAQALPHLIAAAYRPRTPRALGDVLDLVGLLGTATPVFRMTCTVSEEAARMAYEAMSAHA